jgi:hypothetical protein
MFRRQRKTRLSFAIVTEIASGLTLISIFVSSLLAYFSFQNIGVSFFDAVTFDDILVIGIGFLVKVSPVLAFFCLSYAILVQSMGFTRSLFGHVLAINHFATRQQSQGIPQRYANMVPFFASLIIDTATVLLLFMSSISYVLLISMGVYWSFRSMGNLFAYHYLSFAKRVLSDDQNADVMFFALSKHNRSLTDEQQSDARRFKVFVISICAVISLVQTLKIGVRYPADPVAGTARVLNGARFGIPADCGDAILRWSGSKAAIVSCGPKTILLRSPDGLLAEVAPPRASQSSVPIAPSAISQPPAPAHPGRHRAPPAR